MNTTGGSRSAPLARGRSLRSRGARAAAVLSALALTTLASSHAVAAGPTDHDPRRTSVTAADDPSVSRLRREVTSGSLLDQHGVHTVCPRCAAQVVTEKKGSDTPLRTAAPAGYGPADLSKAFGLPATTKSTATIAIIDAGVDPHLASDLAAYRAAFHLPACDTASGCLTLKDYTGGEQPAPQKSGAGAALEEAVALETALDMDAASAACPTCHLLEISVPWQDGEDDNDVSTGDFAQAVNTAVAEGASAVSISYGYTADVTNTSGSILKALTHKGIAITAATGDEGFNGGIHQLWPSNLPSVVAVGGVTLSPTDPATAWWSAGSGCETRFTAATGQPAPAAAACGGHRAAADVSADADPASGLAVYDTYAPSSGEPNDWTIVGGTSASAPYIAGLYARAGHLASVQGPNTLYKARSSDFTDITSGNNETYHACAAYPGVSTSLCTAGPGWDGPTGIGVPHGLGAF
ncbi:peptidase S8 [Streptomyces sp. Act143]|uniref:S8 family serine peptidase n=1 Tax=Streptomyces sp. Act143 TaxID=2200760 RepID=UPI000D673706|nr:S8 family serine peptidase [Streptomyces sp. Act143]PWI15771.1 peptidase S8 [Streptomyces sp. Act143]